MRAIAPDLACHSDDVNIRYELLPAPSVRLFADDRRRRSHIAELIADAGGRLLDHGSVATAADRLDAVVGPWGIVIDLAEDHGASLDALLAQLDGGHMRVLLILTPSLIDLVIARISDPAVTILVDPDEADMADALAHLVAPPVGLLADSSGEADGRRLVQLSEEVGRIARRLAQLSRGVDAGEAADAAPETEPAASAAPTTDIAIVRALLQLRQMRGRHFEPALFADPAWDMMLDLMAADLERRRVAVSSLCIAAMVPPTTALRWITALTEQGLFARHADPADGRRVFIALTEAARTAMERYLAGARAVLAG